MPSGSTKVAKGDILTSEEAAVMLRISYRTLLSNLSQIPHQKIGNQARFSREALEQWLRDGNSVVSSEEKG